MISFTGGTTDEANAAHEGGSDFFAFSINPRVIDGDLRQGEYAKGLLGRRLLPGASYDDWGCVPDCEARKYENGKIWTNVLWQLREKFKTLFRKEQWGIDELHRLYIDGLKLSPPKATMLDLRDSMLLADRNRYPRPGAPGGSAHYCVMYEVFAARGMGVYARDTDETATVPKTVAADFTVPKMCREQPPAPVIACDADFDGDIDKIDIDLILAARNTPAAIDDPRDAYADGWITVNDARVCATRCTRPLCAP